MRTTLTIDDDLMRELKQAALRKSLPFKQIVNQVLRLGLQGLDPQKRPEPYKCPTFPMGDPASRGFDLDKALGLSVTLEDEEIARKLALRK